MKDYFGEGGQATEAQEVLAKMNAPAVQPQGPGSAKQELKKIKESLMKIVEHHLSCHRCKYPCNQVVLANCGHRFCHDCVESGEESPFDHPWISERRTGMKMQCPTCGYGKIDWTQRLFQDDQMIQSLLKVTSPDLDAFYLSAQQRKKQDKTRNDETNRWKDERELALLRRTVRLNDKARKYGVITGLIVYGTIFMIIFMIVKRGDLTLDEIVNPVVVARYLRQAARNFTGGMVRRMKEPVIALTGLTGLAALEEEPEEIIAEID